MPNFRKVVRTSLQTVMGDATNGFNAKLAAIATAYGVTAFTITWTLPSSNFVMAYLEPDSVEVSKLIQFPGAVLFTTTATDLKEIKGKKFSGQVVAVLHFYLRYRSLIDPQHPGNLISEEKATTDMESIPDATEDAALEALRAGTPTFSNGNINLLDFQSEREPVQDFGDGYGQRLIIMAGFSVHI